MRENYLSVRKTTPIRLTFGIQRTKDIDKAHFWCMADNIAYFVSSVEKSILTQERRFFLFAVYW